MASLEFPPLYRQTEWKLLSHRCIPATGSTSSSSSDLVGILDFYITRKHRVVADISGLGNIVQVQEYDMGPSHSHQRLLVPLGRLIRNRIVNNYLLDRLAELGVDPVSSVEIAIRLLGLVCDAINDAKACELSVAVEVEIKMVREVHVQSITDQAEIISDRPDWDAEQNQLHPAFVGSITNLNPSSFEAADHDAEANNNIIGLGTTCAVCLEDLYSSGSIKGNNNLRLSKLPCNHLFHNSCIVPWLETSRTCPLCRRELVEDLID